MGKWKWIVGVGIWGRGGVEGGSSLLTESEQESCQCLVGRSFVLDDADEDERRSSRAGFNLAMRENSCVRFLLLPLCNWRGCKVEMREKESNQ